MISPTLFATLHLALLVALLVGLGLSARPSRMATGRHRGVRYRRLTTDAVLRRLARDGRWDTLPGDLDAPSGDLDAPPGDLDEETTASPHRAHDPR